MLTDTNTSVNFTALSLSGMHSTTTSVHQENQVDAPRRQYGHHPIPKRFKVTYGINTHNSRARGDYKDKRPKFVMSPRAQGLVSNTHHGKKHMLMTCTHDCMIGGKAAKRSKFGVTAKKTTFWMRQIMQLYLSPLRKTIEVGGFPPLRPKCHTTVVTPTKMECSVMIIIDKGPNKGLLFEPNTGSDLGHPVGFSVLSRIFPTANSSNHTMVGLQIHPHDVWFHHTVGFSFFTTIPFKDLVYGQR